MGLLVFFPYELLRTSCRDPALLKNIFLSCAAGTGPRRGVLESLKASKRAIGEEFQHCRGLEECVDFNLL